MIHVENLVKTFGEVKAVDDVSFDVAAGEIFAFLGPNGAGKTTTIQMLTTLLRPTSGTMAIDGLDPATRPHEVRRRFGIVFQDPSLDGADRLREHGPARRALSRAAHASRTSASSSCSRCSSCGTGATTLREDVLRRHEAAARDRARPAAHAEDPVPRRADARPRSAEPQSALDARQAPERDRRRHRVPDDALHGRSGPRRAPHRDHRPRPDRRAGHVAGAEGSRPSTESLEKRVPGADRLDDPRRARRRGRSDAAGRARCGGDDR